MLACPRQHHVNAPPVPHSYTVPPCRASLSGLRRQPSLEAESAGGLATADLPAGAPALQEAGCAEMMITRDDPRLAGRLLPVSPAGDKTVRDPRRPARSCCSTGSGAYLSLRTVQPILVMRAEQLVCVMDRAAAHDGELGQQAGHGADRRGERVRG